MRRNGKTRLKGICGMIGFVGLAVLVFLPAGAYDRYSIDDDATNCRFCHGDFRASSYVSLSDGQNWGNLHNLHRQTMLNGDCDTCHLSADKFPVMSDNSQGGNGLAPIGCIGCHGRAEDVTGSGTEGYGTALQRRHETVNAGGDQNGETCFDCHTNAVTAVPVGENVLPPYYASPGVNHPNMPVDPCNPNGTEDFAGLSVGIDNDGDLAADLDDPDCTGAVVTPGEASGSTLPALLVTGKTATTMSFNYGVPCEATDHRIHFGPLGQVSDYFYTGTKCNLLNSGTFTWAPPALPSMFFMGVGHGDEFEGSYGIDSDGGERPASLVGSTCKLPQDLDNRCDP